jgi:hypothetical protein
MQIENAADTGRASKRSIHDMHERIGCAFAGTRATIEHPFERERTPPVLDCQFAHRETRRIAQRAERGERRHDPLAQ